MKVPSAPDGFVTEPKPPPTRKKVEGARHAWVKSPRRNGIEVATCKGCQLVRETAPSKASRSEGYGGPSVPEVRYRQPFESHWMSERPPCVNRKQTELFPTVVKGDPLPPEVVKRRVKDTLDRIYIPDAEIIEEIKQREELDDYDASFGPSVYIPIEHEHATVTLECSGDGIFGSEWHWTVFVHVEPETAKLVRVPNVKPISDYAGIAGVDKIAHSLQRLIPNRPGVWIVCKRREPEYMRAWKGNGRGWDLVEKGIRDA